MENDLISAVRLQLFHFNEQIERERKNSFMMQRWGVKVALGLMAMCLAGYILGPPLYWHLIEGFAAAVTRSSSPYSSSCPPCNCDCDSHPLLSIPRGSMIRPYRKKRSQHISSPIRKFGLSNASFTECAKHDPEVGEDTEKNLEELLSEELKLRGIEGVENQRRADTALLEAKKLTSQYMKEADKCNSGMETCEAAREKADAALVAQKRLSATWETRAHEMGWKDTFGKSHSQSQGGLDTM
ncbi:unnamed protein product [Cuscuta epithymum]|uniref:Uncharacterized protein n=1 Tax=Cuscuta epithymum TaxID=186058 RepID=A0AAV0E6E5_9ASTE|nr:unnamed protein product [Cuscuta epithymum]